MRGRGEDRESKSSVKKRGKNGCRLNIFILDNGPISKEANAPTYMWPSQGEWRRGAVGVLALFVGG